MHKIDETLDGGLVVQVTEGKFFFIKRIVKKIVSLLFDCFYHFVLTITYRRVQKNKKYYISICTVFKDEAKFLKEWIDFHEIVGVDHFYLYNNFSSDDYMEVLTPYIKRDLVTLIDWPFEKAQIQAFNDCFKKYKEETSWLTFIDVDEFFCPYYKDTIKEWLVKYEKYPSILIYWKMFGTSGFLFHDESKYVIEQYENSWVKCYSIGKQILNTSYSLEEMYHHYVYVPIKFLWTTIKIPSMNEFNHFIKYPDVSIVRKKNSIQLNHYWSKAYNEFLLKRGKGDVFYGREAQTRTDDIFFNFEKRNKNKDVVIKRFLIKLKLQASEKNENFN